MILNSDDLTPEDATETLKYDFARLSYISNLDSKEMQIIDMLHVDDPETLPLAVDLLSSGPDLARSEARAIVQKAMTSLRDAQYYYPTNLSLWRDNYPDHMSPHIKNRLVSAWTLGSLRDEFLGGMDTFFLSRAVASLDEKLCPVGIEADRSSNRAYWKGVCLLAIHGFSVTDSHAHAARDFAVWVGDHSDYKRVMRLARERRTFSVETLAPILAEQDRTASPLRTGTL